MTKVQVYLIAMGAWTVVVLVPGVLLGRYARATGRATPRKVAGGLLVFGLFGLAVIFALLVTVFLRGYREPFEGWRPVY